MLLHLLLCYLIFISHCIIYLGKNISNYFNFEYYSVQSKLIINKYIQFECIVLFNSTQSFLEAIKMLITIF